MQKTHFKNLNTKSLNKRCAKCAKCQLFIFMFTALVLLVLYEVLERSHVTSVSKDTQEPSVRGKPGTVMPEEEKVFTYNISHDPFYIGDNSSCLLFCETQLGSHELMQDLNINLFPESNNYKIVVYVDINVSFVPAVDFIIMPKLLNSWLALFFPFTFFSLLSHA